MNFQEYIVGPECGVDIYEEPVEDKWVQCSQRKARVYGYTTCAIMVIIIILILFFGSTETKIWGTLILSILIILNVVYIEVFSGKFARVEYKRFEKEVDSYMKDGKSRADAIKEIKKERIAREQIAAQREAAAQQAAATTSGLFAVANALRRR
jgi:hypothetical protein